MCSTKLYKYTTLVYRSGWLKRTFINRCVKFNCSFTEGLDLYLLQENQITCLSMDNPSFTPDKETPPYIAPVMKESPPPYARRAGLEEMEEVRRNLDPNAFSAPLNHGELSVQDKFSLAFLISFPCFFFVLGIILTSILR